jgi:glycosyltransferase involved in cell wall biosynthesis
MGKRVVISVISDLVTDQRVHKVATTLHNHGMEVVLIGAKRSTSKHLENRAYTTKRISLWFQKGFAMYAEWNLRLFFKLFICKADILLANDLDTLLPNFLHAKMRSKQLVYDSHEYFTEQEEVQNRKLVKKIWTTIEQFIFPKLKYAYTVNESIANIYRENYRVTVKVVRNVPLLQNKAITDTYSIPKECLGKKILISQGTGINANRGYEELIQAMHYIPNDFILCIVGSGLVLDNLKELVHKENLNSKVLFMGVLNPADLAAFTAKAFCGFTLDKPTCLNYVYSLPNKLFNYLHAGVPVIGSALPEVEKIITTCNVGIVIKEVQPKLIADAVLQLANDASLYTNYKANTIKAKQELCWEQDAKVLLEIFA